MVQIIFTKVSIFLLNSFHRIKTRTYIKARYFAEFLKKPKLTKIYFATSSKLLAVGRRSTFWDSCARKKFSKEVIIGKIMAYLLSHIWAYRMKGRLWILKRRFIISGCSLYFYHCFLKIRKSHFSELSTY